jgi:hypothetical protein
MGSFGQTYEMLIVLFPGVPPPPPDEPPPDDAPEPALAAPPGAIVIVLKVVIREARSRSEWMRPWAVRESATALLKLCVPSRLEKSFTAF